MSSARFAYLNASLEVEFEEAYSRIFVRSNQDERYFLTIHKYCLRKKYVSLRRRNPQVGFVYRFLYWGFVKFDSYTFLCIKVFCNIVVYFFLLPLFNFRGQLVGSMTQLRQAYPTSKSDYFDNSIYYPGTLNHFISYRQKIKALFTLKEVLCAFREIKLPKLSFVRDVATIIAGKQSSISFSVSVISFYALYHTCNGMLSRNRNTFDAHYTYGAVVAPQKVFALHFLRERKDSVILSHGNFHDAQCTYQPATKFIDLSGDLNTFGMSSSNYFQDDELQNPCKPISYRYRNCLFSSLSDILRENSNSMLHASRVLVFSSTYDCGIGRDAYYGIFFLIQLLLKHGYKNLEVKLHPSESVVFFRLLCLIQLRHPIRIVEPGTDYASFDAAFGVPSTFITELGSIEKIYVYSPLEYTEYDFGYAQNVEYFSEIA